MAESPEMLRQRIVGMIEDERRRQIAGEGHDPAADRRYVHGELAHAAAAYAYGAAGEGHYILAECSLWPDRWDPAGYKPSSPARDLIKAGALILAELERCLGSQEV